jgi:hypothetical protein
MMIHLAFNEAIIHFRWSSFMSSMVTAGPQAERDGDHYPQSA